MRGRAEDVEMEGLALEGEKIRRGGTGEVDGVKVAQDLLKRHDGLYEFKASKGRSRRRSCPTCHNQERSHENDSSFPNCSNDQDDICGGDFNYIASIQNGRRMVERHDLQTTASDPCHNDLHAILLQHYFLLDEHQQRLHSSTRPYLSQLWS